MAAADRLTGRLELEGLHAGVDGVVVERVHQVGVDVPEEKAHLLVGDERRRLRSGHKDTACTQTCVFLQFNKVKVSLSITSHVDVQSNGEDVSHYPTVNRYS